MQIHLISGKGGVGKSMVSLALARQLSDSGKKVLLVELGEESFFAHFLGLPQVEYTPQFFKPGGFWLARWEGTSALSEYVKHLIKIESLHRLFFENQVTRRLVDAAPGLKELAILGKITSGPPRWVGPKLDFDYLVVDAFASGHFLALLRAPLGMAATFHFGPMAEQSRAIMQTLSHPQWTQLHLVSLPEELPTLETMETQKALQKLLPQEPYIWINRCWEIPETHVTSLHELQQQQKQAYIKLSQLPNVRTLPFVTSTDPLALMNTLSKALA